MREDLSCPKPERVLRTLKAFQRDTVDYVYRQMYEDTPPVRRFLVADEVGLGKTLVARGVVARAIEHLWDKVGRIDIVYICSNSGIARQNIRRLNITGHTDHQLPDRITLLPRDIQRLRTRKLSFISFTPGTSFNMRSSMGVAEERALLFWLLPEEWRVHRHGAISALTGTAGRPGFQCRVDEFRQRHNIDDVLAESFRAALSFAEYGGEALKARFVDLAERLGRREVLTDEELRERSAIVGQLRALLARVCVKELEPDLIILDEFQRFKDLLDGDDFAAELARALFTYANEDSSEHARVLLLSATPYKMFTQHEEAGGEDHLRDFLQTVRFLHDNRGRTDSFAADLGNYSRALLRYRSEARGVLCQAKSAVEQSLRDVMVRTERLAVTANRNGMLVEVPVSPLTLQAKDLTSYLALQRVAAVVDHGDTVEYWKSAPYALNFMDDYQLKHHFKAATETSESAKLFQALTLVPNTLLTRVDLEAYQAIDPANARLRWLLHQTVQDGAAEMFWMPPASPYYKPEGVFANTGHMTKRLVFSAWQVVPKVVASVLSFEAERRLIRVPDEGEPGANTPAARRKRRGLLRYAFSQGRLTGMPVLALIYPSPALASLGDPLSVARELSASGDIPELSEVLARVQERLRTALAQIDLPPSTAVGGDQKWYWAAPLLLDLARDEQRTREWFAQAELARRWSGDEVATQPAPGDGGEEAEEPDRWSAHVDEARRLLREGPREFGAPPQNLVEVLALLAVGGLANNALRALCRVTGGEQAAAHSSVRNAAGRIAQGLRSLFNQPDVTARLKGTEEDDERYWIRVLEYSARGCLSAVLDEYAHMALEADSLPGKSVDEITTGIAERMVSALTLQTATLRADIVVLNEPAGAVRMDVPFGFRTAFAVRYGARGEEGAAADRNQRLQIAFNSPFWPFVLCTTSVGQEGLDFHPYCHAVVHWNLPSNPVDLEQREGRVHRYKGHAVRKNVASRHRRAALTDGASSDPWAAMFKDARSASTDDDSDLVPYWVYCVDGGAQIERHVPALPLSRDAGRKEALKRSLTLYRMAFGQSRQEDLVAFLQRHVPAEEQEQLMVDLLIDLSPPASPDRAASGVDEAVSWAEQAPAELEKAFLARTQGPHGRSLARFNELLDSVKALASSRNPDVEVRRAQPGELALRSLLDEFVRTRSTEPSSPSELRREVPKLSPTTLANLLDAFVANRTAPPEVDDPLPRYRDLLEEYARASGAAGRASFAGS